MSDKKIVEYDEKRNEIYCKYDDDYEVWREFDERSNCIHYKDSENRELWQKWERNKRIKITEKEFEQIKRIKEEKEFNSREKVSRFQLMDI